MDFELQDVHVVVTGASGGIGSETARLFLKQGAKVTAHYNTNASSLNTLITEFGADRVVAAQANLAVEDDVVRLFRASEILGPVQIAIINHGIWPTADESVATMSLDRWRTTLDTNLTSSFLVAREFLRQLEPASDAVKAKASILFIGSTAGKYGEAGHADYAASKSALMYGLTLSLKNEIVKIAPRGRVNAVAPGWVNTPMATETLKDRAFVYRVLATTPLKKVAEPWDIAAQIVVLSSPSLSGHITGQVLMVEGGMEGRLLNRNTELGLEAY
ncbi:NAD(P)-binding protein [Mycena rosella]|uniref:NAD(P)-binding protein n=1 Tax=Mycena rosella TaxID=1033263 RepID=A0AAD7DH63_MYCRO|nr:NAD(P)-binding protein [Mycena rosella]KAJ7691635.1 NAD(P)-binding protein [Mycena rosella]